MSNQGANQNSQPILLILLESLQSLRLMGRRTLLALLGIAMGCAAVIALTNIGFNAANESLKTFRNMGSNILTASFPPHQNNYKPSPTQLDLQAFGTALPMIEHVAPLILNSSYISLKGRESQSTIVGTSSALADILNLNMKQGRFLSNYDHNSTYAVIGAHIARKFAPISLGDLLPAEGYLFEVIGILEETNSNPLIPVPINESLFIPIEGMRRLSPKPEIGTIMVRTKESVETNAVASSFKDYLDSISPGREAQIQIPQQLLDGLERQASTFSYLLTGLGGISLLVGGVGVMNVMLMNVSERRREIGIRIALGATPKNIRNLFLMEAATLSIAGSLLGAGAGLAAAYAFSWFSEWSFSLALFSLPLGIGSSLLIGLFFGLSPALSAARLQPVQALRDD